jgi:hypothetical protein
VPGGSVLPGGKENLIAFALFQSTAAASATPQSFSGFCASVASVTDPTASGTTVLYGLGTLNPQNCSSQTRSVPASNDGVLIVDSGVLTNFIAYADCSNRGTMTDNGAITIYVNGVSKGLAGTLGVSMNGLCIMKNKTLQIPVNEQDRVAVTVTVKGSVNNAEGYSNVNVAFSKQ